MSGGLNMKKRILLIFLVCILVAIDVLLSYHKIEEDNVYDAEKDTYEIIVGDLNQRIVKQKILFHSKSIEGIKVKTATFDRVPVGTMKVKIIQEENVLAEKTVKGEEIKNNASTNINFDKKVAISSDEYSIVFDLTQLSNETPITFYAKRIDDNELLFTDEGLNVDNILDLQYYTHEFSFKRFIYIFVSTNLLLSYAILIIRLIKKNR